MWEVDALRGIAVLMMLLANFVADLSFFGLTDNDISRGWWGSFSRSTAGLFLVIVGISLTLSAARAGGAAQAGFRKYLVRGLKLFSLAIVITLATRAVLSTGYVLFGVLHLIGIGIILSYPLLKLRVANLLVTGCAAGAGIWLAREVRVDFPWLLWLGLRPEGYMSVDYAPLLPWFSLIALGIFLGHLAYPLGHRGFRLPDLSRRASVRVLTYLGRRSLLIYLVHQPVLLAGFYAFRFVTS